MKVTVCQLRNTPSKLERDWQGLVEHACFEESDLVVLPEMPFFPWLPSRRTFDHNRWSAAVSAHENWISRLADLNVNMVVGTRPVAAASKRYNEGFVWTPGSGCNGVHLKSYLPDEPFFWEASWYHRGPCRFDAVDTAWGRLGFLICTEMWFGERARRYGHQGVDMIVSPRATPATSSGKWVTGGRTAAVVSGAYSLSSNLVGELAPGCDFGGVGWIIEPEEGEVLAVTTPKAPYLTLEIDLSIARKAKTTYPRYVPDDYV